MTKVVIPALFNEILRIISTALSMRLMIQDMLPGRIIREQRSQCRLKRYNRTYDH